MPQPEFHLDTPIALGLQRYLKLLEETLQLKQPIEVYLAGGMAAHLYTAKRVTTDIDAEFPPRMLRPTDLWITVDLGTGRPEKIYLDTNYNGPLGMIHEDYQADSIPLDLGLEKIHLRVLSPVDLAVSKISRLADTDKQDIRDLVAAGLTTTNEIVRRASEALSYAIGNPGPMRMNIRDAVEIARKAEAERAANWHSKPPSP